MEATTTSFLASDHLLLLLVLPAVAFAYVTVRIYRAFRGSLSHLPGPQISRFTHLRLKVANMTGDRVRYVHCLHERYGPVVRIAPAEVSLCSISATKAVYKIGTPFQKTAWYASFTAAQKEKGLISMIDPHEHAQHRRFTANNFSEKWIQRLEPFLTRNVQLAVKRMNDEEKTRGCVDVFKWFTFMATDVIGEASFGVSFRMLETGKKNQYIEDFEQVGKRGAIRAELPLVAKIMEHIPFGPGKEINLAANRILQYSEQSIERYWTEYRADPENVKPTLLTKEYQGLLDGTITQGQLVRDGAGHIAAGTDTTSIAATYAVWLLAQHPNIEADLIREVSTLPADFTDEQLKQLSLLDNVIKETLRLRSPVGQCLPRVAPPGGAEFEGFFIPQNTTVGIQAWSMHRDPAVWPRAELFEPARWENTTKEMRDAFLPFGSGSRICLGMNVAYMELRHALANFYRTFEAGVKPSYVEGFTEEDMTPISYFMMPPRAKRCLVTRRK